MVCECCEFLVSVRGWDRAQPVLLLSPVLPLLLMPRQRALLGCHLEG
jgi:hypothetical protein